MKAWEYLNSKLLSPHNSADLSLKDAGESLCTQLLSPVQTFASPQTVSPQTPLSKEFSGQEYWSGLPFPTPGDLPDPGIKPGPPAFPALAGGFFIAEPPGKHVFCYLNFTDCSVSIFTYIINCWSHSLISARTTPTPPQPALVNNVLKGSSQTELRNVARSLFARDPSRAY